MKEQKTIVEKLLDQKKIEHKSYSYDNSQAFDGVTVAEMIGKPADCVFKTLVCVGNKGNCVFVVPVAKELDLKKAAKASGQKYVEMIKQKELLPLTGYIHGGCSPVGMKKKFKTVIDESAKGREFFYVSAGKVGFQVKVSPEKLANFIGADFADLTV